MGKFYIFGLINISLKVHQFIILFRNYRHNARDSQLQIRIFCFMEAINFNI